MKNTPHLKEAIIEVVDNQLKSNDPPETRQTYDRLIKEGFSENKTKELIGCVVTSEIFGVLKKQETFDLSRFVSALDNLPTIPEE
jgi:hypothetical protein